MYNNNQIGHCFPISSKDGTRIICSSMHAAHLQMPDFPKLTFCTRFATEVSIPPHLLLIRKVWPLNTPSTHSLSTRLMCTQQVNTEAQSVVPKPHGQVSEISKGRYSLICALDWEEAQYKAIQVRNFGDYHLLTPIDILNN